MKKVLMALAVCSLVACKTTGGDKKSSGAKLKQAESTDRLSPRVMGYGDCGLFVWQLDPEAKLVLFSRADKDTADWWSETTGEIQLERLSAEGFERQGQSPVQTFGLPVGGELRLTLRNPEPVDNGTRYKNGTLTLPANDGFEKVTPVFGISACNSNPIVSDYSERTTR